MSWIVKKVLKPFRSAQIHRRDVDPLQITVRQPLKTESSYVFQIDVRDPSGRSRTYPIGITDTNFPLRHHALWDTYFPLMFITRKGGPLFGKKHSRASIRFEHPASRPVVEFFRERARQFGLEIEVTSHLAEIGLDGQTQGDLLLFGGGKDSRLLLGALREIGKQPIVVSARGAKYSSDIEGARTFETIDFSMSNRIVPALMMLPKTVYHGSALGEVHLTRPWHQYFDISAPLALNQTSEFFRSIGLDISFEVPAATLPHNLVQNILARSYPELYRNQISVDKNADSIKTLHISLARKYHGLDHSEVCDEDTFTSLAGAFIEQAQNQPDTIWGYRHNREIFSREMRCILSRLNADGRVKLAVPDGWEEDWIDSIHLYANPRIDKRFLDIFMRHAEVLDPRQAHLPEQLRALL